MNYSIWILVAVLSMGACSGGSFVSRPGASDNSSAAPQSGGENKPQGATPVSPAAPKDGVYDFGNDIDANGNRLNMRARSADPCQEVPPGSACDHR